MNIQSLERIAAEPVIVSAHLTSPNEGEATIGTATKIVYENGRFVGEVLRVTGRLLDWAMLPDGTRVPWYEAQCFALTFSGLEIPWNTEGKTIRPKMRYIEYIPLRTVGYMKRSILWGMVS